MYHVARVALQEQAAFTRGALFQASAALLQKVADNFIAKSIPSSIPMADL
jgi:hypothetical protein